MHPMFVSDGTSPTVPILFLTTENIDSATRQIDDHARAFMQASGFEPKPGRHLLIPDTHGGLAWVLLGLENADDPGKDLFRPGSLAGLLPPGVYRFANSPHDPRL